MVAGILSDLAFGNKADNLYVSHSNCKLKVGDSYQEYYSLAQS